MKRKKNSKIDHIYLNFKTYHRRLCSLVDEQFKVKGVLSFSSKYTACNSSLSYIGFRKPKCCITNRFTLNVSNHFNKKVNYMYKPFDWTKIKRVTAASNGPFILISIFF